MSSTLNTTIGKLVKSARTKEKMSQGKLAEIVGTKQGYISKLESGKVNPTINLLEKIAEALNKKIGIYFN